MRPAKALLAGAAVVVGTSAWLQLPASAHYPDVVAENVCADGVPAVGVTATAWQSWIGEDHRINNDVRIDAWGPHTSQSVEGVFVAPDYESRVVLEVPGAIGDTLTIRATAVAPWGPNGEYGYAGTWRETTITVADVCHEETFGGEERAPETTAAPPPTTTSIQLPAAESVTPAPVQVMGATVTRVPAQVVSPTELAFTGDHTAQLASVGVLATILGACSLALSRRRTLARPVQAPSPQ